MAVKGERYMRVIVFFDLPTVTKKDKKIAAEFRKFLLQDGYYMLQWSVYSRVCKGMAEVEPIATGCVPFCPIPEVFAF